MEADGLRRIVFSALLAAGLQAAGAGAVVLRPGGVADPTAPPQGLPVFSSVGTVGGLTAVYLGDDWVVTASHVVGNASRPEIVLGGVTYRAVPNSRIQLETRPGVTADLVLFRIDGAPPLSKLRLAESPPRSGEVVTLVGNGWLRDPQLVYWNSVWEEVSPARAYYTGYRRKGMNALRWGRDEITWTERDAELGANLTRAFETRFDQTGGPREQCAAVTGDSGGAAFIQGESGWELAGILFARRTHPNQPAGTIVYGNVSQVADLSFYREQILDVTRGHEVVRTGMLAAVLVAGGLVSVALTGLLRRRGGSAPADE